MSGPDDYLEDMKRLNGLSDRDIDRLLHGQVPPGAEDLEDLARHLGGLKRAQAHVPADVAARQIAQIVLTSAHSRDAGWSAPAASSRSQARKRVRSMQKRLALLTAKIGAVFVGASMLTVGLAFAGAQLPDAVNEAWSKAGVELPNQATEALAGAQGRPEDAGRPETTGNDTSAAVLSAIDGWTGEDRGCLFGMVVASAASGEAKDTGHCGADENGGGANARGSKATGDERSAEGRAKAASASGGAGSGNAQDGAATAADKSDGRAGAGNAPESQPRPQGGQSTGQEAAEQGKANKDNAPRSGNESDDTEE